MKTKPTANIENLKDELLPSCEQLATIAAAIQRKNPAAAVKQSLALWRESEKVLREAAEAKAQLEFADIVLPPKFPAKFDDFLRLVVRAKTPADSEKRLRDFYRDEHTRWLTSGKPERLNQPLNHWDTEKKKLVTIKPDDTKEVEGNAAAQIGGWKQNGFKTKEQWLRLAKRYSNWWRSKISLKARAAASKRVSSK
jgi:hypothetical protein